MICPSCGYETFHPQAKNCDLCGAFMQAETSPAPEAGDLDLTTLAQQVSDESDVAPVSTGESSRVAAAVAKVAPPRATSTKGGPNPLAALAFGLSLPVTWPAVVAARLSSEGVSTPAGVGSAVIMIVLGLTFGLYFATPETLGWLALPAVALVSGVFGAMLLFARGEHNAGGGSVFVVLVGVTVTALLWPRAPVAQLVLRAGRDTTFTAFAWEPNSGARLLTGGDDGSVALWDAKSGKRLTYSATHRGEVSGVAFLRADRAVSAGRDGTVRLWDLRSGAQSLVVKALSAGVEAVAAAGDLVAYGGPTGQLVLMRFEERSPLEPLHEARITALAFDPQAELLVSGDEEGRLLVWDVETKEFDFELEGHDEAVSLVRFSADGTQVLSAACLRVRVLDLESQAGGPAIEAASLVRSAALSPDGSEVAVAHIEGVGLWRLDGDEATRVGHLELPEMQSPTGVAFSPDGTLLAVTDGERLVVRSKGAFLTE